MQDRVKTPGPSVYAVARGQLPRLADHRRLLLTAMRTSGDSQELPAIGRYADALIAIEKLRMRRDLFTGEKIVSAELLTLTRTAPVGTEVVVRIEQPMAAAAEHVECALIKRARRARG